MTKNQIELIKAREMERANRAQEELASQGQNKSLIGTLTGSVFRGLASTLIPHGKAVSHAADAVARTINNDNRQVRYTNVYNRSRNNNHRGGQNNGK